MGIHTSRQRMLNILWECIEGAECTICENGKRVLETFEQSVPGDYDMIFTSESQFPIPTIQLSKRNTKEKKNMSELESMIEEKLIEQLIYGDSQWNNFSESIKVSKYQAK